MATRHQSKSRTKRRADQVADDNRIVDDGSDLVWGARAIGRVINRTERAAFFLLEKGSLQSVKKIDGRYVASRKRLLEECGA